MFLNFRRSCYASFLVLFAAASQHYLPPPAQGNPVAREKVGEANPATAEPERHSISSDKRSTVEVPILVYHHIRQFVPVGSRVERRVTVTVEIFDQQMRYIRENGHHVVTLNTLANYIKDVGELPTKPVIISFDDGWEDQFVNAVPLLQKYNYPATFFVVTNLVGSTDFLSWSQLQGLLLDGMNIGSHSKSHPRLDRINNPDMLWDQIFASKQIIEHQLGTTADEFAYPYGSYNAITESIVRAAGYRAARACCIGRVQSDAYALRAVMAPNDLVKFGKYLDARTPSRRNSLNSG